jgi:hypothetical protein
METLTAFMMTKQFKQNRGEREREGGKARARIAISGGGGKMNMSCDGYLTKVAYFQFETP